MAIRDVASALKNWALANRMIGDDEHLQPQVDQDLVRAVFGRVGVPAATRILQGRGISYIGINELSDEIIIFTKRKLNTREQKMLQAAAYISAGGKQRIGISFEHSNFAHVGLNPQPPTVPPFTLHNKRYTCGSSIYIGSEKGAGTLACLLLGKDKKLYGLSNNHVSGGSNYANPGLPITAPGILDVAAGGKDPETLGHHRRAYPFIDGLPDVVNAEKNLDAAIFEIANEDRVSSMQRSHYDTPTKCIPLEIDMDVEKVGRTTGKTSGKVIAELFDFEPVWYDVDVINGRKRIYFKSLFMIKADSDQYFSYSGDSGSLITATDKDKNKSAVGIVVAGNEEKITFALSLDRILTYFDTTLVSGHNV